MYNIRLATFKKGRKKGDGVKGRMIQWYLTLKTVDKLFVQVLVAEVKSAGARMRQERGGNQDE